MFLINGTGLHVGLEYCCGEVESISIFQSLNLELDDCCGDMKSEDCSHSNEVVAEQEPLDLQSPSKFDLEPAAQVDLPSKEIEAKRPDLTILPNLDFFLNQSSPPVWVVNQQFRC